MKQVASQPQAHLQWLAEPGPAGGTVLVDGPGAVARRSGGPAPRAGAQGYPAAGPISTRWRRSGASAPALPAAPVYAHAAPQAPHPRSAKLAQVREKLKDAKADWHFISRAGRHRLAAQPARRRRALQPVFLAHVRLGSDSCQLFIDPAKVPAEIRTALVEDGVNPGRLPPGGRRAGPAGRPAVACWWTRRGSPSGWPRPRPKGSSGTSRINPRPCSRPARPPRRWPRCAMAMEEDGAALCVFFARFEAALARGERLTELTVDDWLSEAARRRAQLRLPELRHHRRLQRRWRPAALPGDRRGPCRTPGRRPCC